MLFSLEKQKVKVRTKSVKKTKVALFVWSVLRTTLCLKKLPLIHSKKKFTYLILMITLITDAYQIRISADTMPIAPAQNDNNMAKKQENNNNNQNNNNNNNNNSTPNKKPAKTDAPLVTYETSGEGKKLPIVIFHCNALSQPQPMAAGKILYFSKK